jgi:hypothetical protein
MVRVSLDRTACEPSVYRPFYEVKGEDKKVYKKKALLRKFTRAVNHYTSIT